MLTGVVLAMLMFGTGAGADQTSPRLVALFDALRNASDFESASATEREIWKIWSLPDNRTVSVAFAQGVLLMNGGDLKTAKQRFDTVVREAPNFAEGWNKRATVAYYLGDFDTSVRDIQKTLALEPRHFGALSGLALIYQETELEAQALDVLIRVKEIYPVMPGIDERMDALRAAIAARKT